WKPRFTPSATARWPRYSSRPARRSMPTTCCYGWQQGEDQIKAKDQKDNVLSFCLLPFAFCLLPFAFCLLVLRHNQHRQFRQRQILIAGQLLQAQERFVLVMSGQFH